MGVRVENIGKNLGKLNRVKIGRPIAAISGEILLDPNLRGGSWTLSNNNRTAANSGSIGKVLSQNSATSGKWYWEISFDSGTTVSGGYHILPGIATSTALDFSIILGRSSDGYAYSSFSGEKFHNDINEVYGSAYGPGSIIGIALDIDNGKIWWSLNGTFQDSGDPANGVNPAYSGLSGTFRAGISDGASLVLKQ